MYFEFHEKDKISYKIFMTKNDAAKTPVDLTSVTEVNVKWLTNPKDKDSAVLDKTGDGTSAPILILEPKTDGVVEVQLTPIDTDLGLATKDKDACLAHAVQIIDNEGPLTLNFDKDNLSIKVKPPLF
jgi:hypothetical protein